MIEPYLRQNHRYADSALVAIANARIFYGLPMEDFRPGEAHYESALSISRTNLWMETHLGPVYDLFEMARGKPAPPFEGDPAHFLKSGLCIAWNMMHPRYGLHSTLITDYREGFFEVINAQVHDEDFTIEWLTGQELHRPRQAHLQKCLPLYPATYDRI